MDEELIATNSVYGVLWAEGENVTSRLKECEKKKGMNNANKKKVY